MKNVGMFVLLLLLSPTSNSDRVVSGLVEELHCDYLWGTDFVHCDVKVGTKGNLSVVGYELVDRLHLAVETNSEICAIINDGYITHVVIRRDDDAPCEVPATERKDHDEKTRHVRPIAAALA